MENKKKITLLLLFFMLLVVGCNSPQQKLVQTKKIICANDPSLFTKINGSNLLFTDSLSNVYLRIENTQLAKEYNELSHCQKLPYVFLKEVALKNDSIVELKDVINISTFQKFSENIYTDRDKTYYYETNIATYPPLFELNINPKNKKKLDSLKNKQ